MGDGGKEGEREGRRGKFCRVVSTSAIKGTPITRRRAQSLKLLVRSRD